MPDQGRHIEEQEQLLKDYAQLAEEVRMRQHALENQLSAVQGMQGAEAEQYLEKLNRDQRYNHLLLCGEPLLAGLVHRKCQRARECGIEIGIHVAARMRGTVLPLQDVTAMVGILLDNAIEAENTRSEAERYISITFDEENGCSRITVANRYPYVPYNEMGKWFGFGHSSKGGGHGVGLAHVREICSGGDADIIYGNRDTEDGKDDAAKVAVNEVFFTLAFAAEPEEQEENRTGAVTGQTAGSKSRNRPGVMAVPIALAVLAMLFFAYRFFRQAKQPDGILAETETIAGTDTGLEQENTEGVSGWVQTPPKTVEELRAQFAKGHAAPYYLYEENEWAPEDGVQIVLPENDLWETDAFQEDMVRPGRILLEYYDAAGNHTGRDTYIAGGMDSAEDKGYLHDLGEEVNPPRWMYQRRVREHWDYDAEGRELLYTCAKQYGETKEAVILQQRDTAYGTDGAVQTVSVQENGEKRIDVYEIDPAGTVRCRHRQNAAGTVSETLEYEYDAEGYPLVNAEGIWQWEAEHRKARLSVPDREGKAQESLFVYNDQGQPAEKYYLQDGVFLCGYRGYFDEAGNCCEECDMMPIRQNGRLSEDYRNLFYDEACTKQREPRGYAGIYRYHAYDGAGREAYRLEADTLEGYGDLYLYHYDDAGRLAVTYVYRVFGQAMDGFALKTQEGGRLLFSCGYREYTLYEKSGGRWDFMQEYVTQIEKEGADGSTEYICLFSEGFPQCRKTEDGEILEEWQEFDTDQP